jgi:uncharacterized protein
MHSRLALAPISRPLTPTPRCCPGPRWKAAEDVAALIIQAACLVRDRTAREIWQHDLVLVRPDHFVAWRGNTPRVITTCGNLRPQEVREDFAEDAVLALLYAPAGTPKETVGRDQIVAYISLLGNYIKSGIFADHAFDTLAGDPGVVVARYPASTRLLTTRSPYENTYVTLVTVRDGKVARYEEFFDPINWLIAQGGVVESPQK